MRQLTLGSFDTVHQLGLLGAQNKNYNYAVFSSMGYYVSTSLNTSHNNAANVIFNQAKSTPSCNAPQHGFLQLP